MATSKKGKLTRTYENVAGGMIVTTTDESGQINTLYVPGNWQIPIVDEETGEDTDEMKIVNHLQKIQYDAHVAERDHQAKLKEERQAKRKPK